MELVFDLIALVVELVWATVKFLQKLSRVYLPTVFYLTSVALIPALTLDKIVAKSPESRRMSAGAGESGSTSPHKGGSRCRQDLATRAGERSQVRLPFRAKR